MAEDPASVLRGYLEGTFTGAPSTIDATVAPDAVDHAGLPDQPPGIEGFRAFATVVTTAFPDLELTVEDCFGAGDRAAARWSSVSTHTGELLGIPPSGRRVTMTGMDFARVADGKIVELWAQMDMASLMAQITAVDD